MSLGAIDVELTANLAKLHRDVERQLGNITANITAHADTASVAKAEAQINTAIGSIDANVDAQADLRSALRAESVLSAAVGTVDAQVIATADIGSARRAETVLEGAVGTITAPVIAAPQIGGSTGLDDLAGGAAGATGAMSALGPAITLAAGAAAATVGVFAVAGKGLYELAQAASDVGEAQNVASVVFGEGAQKVIDFSETAAQTIGQSQAAALAAAGDFGTFGKAAGLTGDELASFSTDLLTLTSDAASFKNTTPQQAVEAFGAALRGESEPIRAYGVLLDEASVNQAAYAAGIAKPGAELTQQQKVLARYQAILAQTTDIQGDFARTIGESVPNQLRVASAAWDDFQSRLGQAVLPSVAPILDSVSGVLPQIEGPLTIVATEFAQAFETLAPTIADGAEVFADLVEKFSPVIGTIADLGGAALDSLFGVIDEAVNGGAVDGLVEIFVSAGVVLEPVVDVLGEFGILLIKVIAPAVKQFGDDMLASGIQLTQFVAETAASLADAADIAEVIDNAFGGDLLPDGIGDKLRDIAAGAKGANEELRRTQADILRGNAFDAFSTGTDLASAAVANMTEVFKGSSDAVGVVDAVINKARLNQENLAALTEESAKRAQEALDSVPSIADVFTEGDTSIEASVDGVTGRVSELQRRAFGISAANTKGFTALLAEGLAIPPEKQGQFFEELLTLPPEKQLELEQQARDGQAALAAAAKAVAAAEGEAIGKVLNEGVARGLLLSTPDTIAAATAAARQVAAGYQIGIAAGQSSAANAGAVMAQQVIQSTKSALKIKSPSQVFAEIGNQVVAGLTAGIVANTSAATAAAELAGSLQTPFGSAITTAAAVPRVTSLSAEIASQDGSGLTIAPVYNISTTDPILAADAATQKTRTLVTGLQL